ncbi:Uncharacterised protein [Corynebacterium striatum]|nr:Uncharacterised protein [Corynebacterium striatum]
MRGEESNRRQPHPGRTEIPPRARRRAIIHYYHAFRRGNTSACAEKRVCGRWCLLPLRKYLRVRGEEERGEACLYPSWEIPPRARRRATGNYGVTCVKRNTSACAEKSIPINAPGPEKWKYLRVRGEESQRSLRSQRSGEIPPRARRRVGLCWRCSAGIGNTSACAEKRLCRGMRCCWGWKYLRVRGEEKGTQMPEKRYMEIPPRARRRGFQIRVNAAVIGNTSACAEKSFALALALALEGKYLRVRGEEQLLGCQYQGQVEIPPRARRREVRL